MAENPKAENPEDWRPATRMVRGGLQRSGFGETAEALFLTQSFTYPTAEDARQRFTGDQPGYVYSRYGNPTLQMFEDRMALLERPPANGAPVACRAVSSGMAAVTAALMGLLRAGDHVVAGRALFGSCRWLFKEWLPRFGVAATLVDGTDLAAWRAAVRPETKVLFLETPANPLLEMADLPGVIALGREVGARVVVDNVFATPIFQHPLALGADVAIYSATKHVDGQGRVLGGVVLGAPALLDEMLRDQLRHTGPSLSPFNAWVLLHGLTTLELRVRRQSETAAGLADLIAAHPKVASCRYPSRPDHPQHSLYRGQMSGGGQLVAFDLRTQAAAFRFLDALRIVDISNNLADAKTMATHPPTTTHKAVPEEERLAIGVTEGWVRLSVGLEDPADLARDLSRALDAA